MGDVGGWGRVGEMLCLLSVQGFGFSGLIWWAAFSLGFYGLVVILGF